MLTMLVALALLAPSPYAALTAYNGTWTVKAMHPFSGKPGAVDRLENKCTLSADAYTCDQTVNGTHAAMVIFTVVEGQPDTFLVTNVLDSGRRIAGTELHIHGARWTYQSVPSAAGDTMYKTENTFTDPTHIHFVQLQSTDHGATWTETNSGDEARD